MGTKFSTHETVEDISYSNHNKILGETGVQKIATRSLKQNKSRQKNNNKNKQHNANEGIRTKVGFHCN
jgi:hypothetical protein